MKRNDNKESINVDEADAPFAIVTNTKTGKWFRAKKFRMALRSLTCDYPSAAIVPESINDTVSVIGMIRFPLPDCLTKKELVGDNKELHVEIFNKDKIKQDEYFLYSAWISGIDYETNEIVLSCAFVR